jgi:hypothetical protein
LPEAVVEMARGALAAEAAASHSTRNASNAPFIEANVSAPYVGEYSRVSGVVAPNVEVVMRIYRNGSLYTEWYNQSNGSGYFTMYPYWNDCPQEGYVWYLQPGDVVSISAGGETAQTTVVPLVASLDPIIGQLEGRTAPNREVVVEVSTAQEDNCLSQGMAVGFNSDPNGQFLSDVSLTQNLDRRAEARVYAKDSAGNITSTYLTAFHLSTDSSYNGVWGTVNRGASGMAKLNRGGLQIAQGPFVADPTGYFWVYFSGEVIQPGDVITVQDGKQTISTTIPPTDFTLDAAQNRLTGVTSAGRTVRASVYTRDDSYTAVQTTCTWKSDCILANAAANGSINLPVAFDVRPGDYGYVDIYDAEGNAHFAFPVSAPTLVAGPGLDVVQGYWANSYTAIDVSLFDSANNLKADASEFTNYDGEFYAWLGVPMAAGDRVEVSDGAQTRSMTIEAIAGRLNSIADVLSVTGPNWPVVASYENFYGFYYESFECYEETIAGGNLALNLGAKITPGDSASVYVYGPDGNYTLLDLFAFKVFVTQDSNEVFVRTETPAAQVRLLHKRGNTTLFTETLPVQPPGYVWMYSTSTFLAGDYLEFDVLNEAGAPGTDMTLGPLTANANPANNSVYGLSAPYTDSLVQIARSAAYGWQAGWGYIISLGSDPHYEIYFPNDFWGGGWRQPCLNTLVGDRCVGEYVEYITSSGHSVQLAVEPPPAAPPDAFEADNTAATAKPHSGAIQTHTFHATTDVDWVKVTIPGWAVTSPVRLVALNMGWDVAVEMDLYRSNGTTLVEDQEFYDTGDQAFIVWEPDLAGTYLLRVAPLSDEATGHCDSFYDLRIDMTQIGLPVILR